MEDTMIYERKEKLMLLLAAVLGFLFFDFFSGGFGVSVPLYLLIFYAVILWFFTGRTEGINKKAFLLTIPIFLLAATFLLYDNYVLMFFNIIILAVLIIIQLGALTGNLVNPFVSIGTLLDFLGISVIMPVTNLKSSIEIINGEGKKSSKNRKAAGIFLGIVISVPVLAVVIALLMSADNNFEVLIDKIGRIFTDRVAEYFFKIIFGIIAAFPLFAMLFALRRNRTQNFCKIKEGASEVLRIADSTIANTVLIILSIVYLVFIGLQFPYLFGALSNHLPQNFTYAEYARRGFFEMEAVSIINFGILTVFSFLTKKRKGSLPFSTKILSLIVSVITIILLCAALAKMALYVNIYGLTLLRIYTTFTMAATILVFIAFIAKLYYEKFRAITFSVVTVLFLYILLNYINVDRLIPYYNINRYLDGKDKTVTVEMYSDLSDSMMPEITRLFDDKDVQLSEKAKYIFAQRGKVIERRKSWQSFNLSSYVAEKLVKEKNITVLPYRDN